MLAIDDLTKRFDGLVAVSAVNFGRGQVVAIVGSNGVGKTTLFNLITGVICPDSGSASFDEQMPLSLERRRAQQ
jgi:branched-chain amino acid transport system ATP-binding protein